MKTLKSIRHHTDLKIIKRYEVIGRGTIVVVDVAPGQHYVDEVPIEKGDTFYDLDTLYKVTGIECARAGSKIVSIVGLVCVPQQEPYSEYEIWCSGSPVDGQYSGACLLGKGMGHSFDEAVLDFKAKYENGSYITRMQKSEWFDRNPDQWNTRTSNWSFYNAYLYSNEKDAIKYSWR